MKNYIQDDDVITVAAPYDVVSGAGAKVGSLFGVATTDALSGANVALAREGVFEIAKGDSGTAWSVGDLIYWHDGTVKAATKSSSGNTKIGVCVVAAGSTDAVGTVLLIPSI